MSELAFTAAHALISKGAFLSMQTVADERVAQQTSEFPAELLRVKGDAWPQLHVGPVKQGGSIKFPTGTSAGRALKDRPWKFSMARVSSSNENTHAVFNTTSCSLIEP